MAASFSQSMPNGFNDKRVRKHIAQSHSHFEQLEKEWDRLIVDHEDEWVAAYQGRFVFGSSVPAVLAKAKQEKWPLDVIAIDRLTKKRATVLL